jgi:hypothetical protein
MHTCIHCQKDFFSNQSLKRHINKSRCDTMSLTVETKQMLEAIKLLKDANVPDNQVYITLKNKYSGKNLLSIQECIRAQKAKQVEKVNIVSSKVDEMIKHMELSPTHKQLIQDLREQPDILDNEISFVNFYSYYLEQLKIAKDEFQITYQIICSITKMM